MKLSALLEAPPVFVNKDLKLDTPLRPFMSQKSIDRDYEFIVNDKTVEGQEYWIILHKNKLNALIGEPGTREDGVFGMSILGELTFKISTVLSSIKKLNIPKHVLQVSLVRMSEDKKGRGYGFYLYLGLVSAGYVIVSDFTQYIGGKELWKRIAARTVNSKYAVYVLENGEPKLNDNGEPIIYDSKNIDDAILWSETPEKKMTLFVLTSKKE